MIVINAYHALSFLVKVGFLTKWAYSITRLSIVSLRHILHRVSTMDTDRVPREYEDEAMEVDDTESVSSFCEGSTYTESLRSSLLQSVTENGRGYHKASRDSEHFKLTVQADRSPEPATQESNNFSREHKH